MYDEPCTGERWWDTQVFGNTCFIKLYYVANHDDHNSQSYLISPNGGLTASCLLSFGPMKAISLKQ